MPVIGIDIGSSTSTVATISRGAIDIVLNDVSQRYTPTCLSYTPLQRVFGDQAHSQIVSNFKNTCRGFLNLIGAKGEYDNVTELDEFFSSTALKLNEERNVFYEVQNGSDIRLQSALSVTVGYLSLLSEMADRYVGAQCREAVLSYPSWFTESQKTHLCAAAHAAGLKCLRVISEGTAMAMDYGMYRLKQLSDETPTTVALVMVGHSHATVAIVDFYASHCEILSEVSRRDVGGRNIDAILMNHMASGFTKKYGCDPLKNPKTRLKVEVVAAKTKRVLSANSESSYSAECLIEDYDLQGLIKREEFESLCAAEFLPNLSELLTEGLVMSGKPLESLFSVEVTGGVTRIPCVQNLISQVFNKPLSKTLNADECIARGCVLQAAISSKHYMVRKYNVLEKMTKPLNILTVPGVRQFSSNDLEGLKYIELVPGDALKTNLYPMRLELDLPCTVFVSFGDPRDVTGVDFLGQYQILKGAVEMNGGEGEEGEVVLRCGFDEFGSFVLNVNSCEVTALPAHFVDVETMYKLEQEELKRDSSERKRLKMLNDFETFIYTVRDKIQTTHRDFINPELVDGLLQEVDKWQDWLYMNSGASFEALQESYDKVFADWKQVEELYNIYNDKASDLEPFYGKLQQQYNFCCDDDPKWFGATPEERSTFAKRLLDLEGHVREIHEQESKNPKHIQPLFTMEQVKSQLGNIVQDIEKFCKEKKKATPPPPAEPTQDDNNNADVENNK